MQDRQQIINRIAELKKELEATQLEAEAKKLVCNASFGKTNDQYSALYDPYTMGAVTVNGQMALITLVAMVHDVGGNVVSANTDGITIIYPDELDDRIRVVVSEWEDLTGLNMEYCEYRAMYQKDVNNYIAIPTNGSIKLKGVFAIPEESGEIDLQHAPMAQIVSRAVINKLETNKDIELTITECQDIQEFLITQDSSKTFDVSWRGRKLDRMVRFYKAIDGTEIIKTPRAGSGKTSAEVMANSESCVPLPNLPDSFDTITDINYDWYIKEAEKLLTLITHPKQMGLNAVAKELEDQGFTPAIITKGKPRRNNPKSGTIDYSSMLPNETFAACTGRHYGVICQRFANGDSWFYKVERKYKATTRERIMKEEGFEFLFGANYEVPAGATLHPIDEDWLEQFYTESEIKNARK